MLEALGTTRTSVRRKLNGYGLSLTNAQGAENSPNIVEDLEADNIGFYVGVGDVFDARKEEPAEASLKATDVIDIYSELELYFKKKTNNKRMKLIVSVNPVLESMARSVMYPHTIFPGDRGLKVRVCLLEAVKLEEIKSLPYLFKISLDV